MRKISLWKIIRKWKQIKRLISAIIELAQYAKTITIDPKVTCLIEKIRLNLESIFGKYIDDI